MGRQGCGTFDTHTVMTEVKVLDGPEEGQVGPQRYGTFSTDSIPEEVKVLDGR